MKKKSSLKNCLDAKVFSAFDKKDYIATCFKKMAHKKYEYYCISRIIHRLNRMDVEFTTQQLFLRKDGRRALADLYFPQFNWDVEIDENYHSYNKIADEKRTNDIKYDDELIREKMRSLEEIMDTPIEILRIDASDEKTIDDINCQCDEIVKKIETQIEEMGNTFIAWTSPYSNSDFGIKNKVIKVSDNVRYKTMRSVGFAIFNRSFPSGGSYFALQKDKHIYVWFPKLKLEERDTANKYINTYSADGKYIYESSEEDNDSFVKEALQNVEKETRYVFPGYRNYLKKWIYKFKGVYQLDKKMTRKKNIRVWKKIADEIDLNDYFK